MEIKFITKEHRKGITDSLLLERGVQILYAKEKDYEISLEVNGSVRIVFEDTTYCGPSQYPSELTELIRQGKLYEDERIYVDMNNWYEMFVTHNGNPVFDKVIDINLDEITDEELTEIAKKGINDAIRQCEFFIGEKMDDGYAYKNRGAWKEGKTDEPVYISQNHLEKENGWALAHKTWQEDHSLGWTRESWTNSVLRSLPDKYQVKLFAEFIANAVFCEAKGKDLPEYWEEWTDSDVQESWEWFCDWVKENSKTK